MRPTVVAAAATATAAAAAAYYYGSQPADGKPQAAAQEPPSAVPAQAPPLIPGDTAPNDECPICMECIAEEEGVMRCCNAHYFHEGCMRRWLRTQRGATCPCCRGAIQVHAARLRAFLDGSPDIEPAERSVLERLLHAARGDCGGWSDVTAADLVEYGTVVAAAGWGFYSGWTGREWSLADELSYSLQPRAARLATGTGWLVGLASHAAYSVATRNRDTDAGDEGGRRRRRSSRDGS